MKKTTYKITWYNHKWYITGLEAAKLYAYNKSFYFEGVKVYDSSNKLVLSY